MERVLGNCLPASLGTELGPLPSVWDLTPAPRVLQQGWHTEPCGGKEQGSERPDTRACIQLQVLMGWVRLLPFAEPVSPCANEYDERIRQEQVR